MSDSPSPSRCYLSAMSVVVASEVAAVVRPFKVPVAMLTSQSVLIPSWRLISVDVPRLCGPIRVQTLVSMVAGPGQNHDDLWMKVLRAIHFCMRMGRRQKPGRANGNARAGIGDGYICRHHEKGGNAGK